MSKKGKIGRGVKLLIAAAALMLLGSGMMVNLPDNGSRLEGVLLAQGFKSKFNEILSVIDIADEAASKGFNVKQIPQQIFAKFDIVAKGITVASIPVPLVGNTTEGVVFIKTILPLGLPKDESSIYIWKNGKEYPLSRTTEAESEISAMIPLDKGNNYLCFLVKNKNQWWGRSRVLKLDSPGAEIKKEDPPPPPPFKDFWDEANSKNYGNIPKKDSIVGFMGFTTSVQGQTITDIPSPLNGSTPAGMVDSNLVVPNNLTGNGNSVYIWANGAEALVAKNIGSGHRVLSKIILGNGHNYICGIVKNGNAYVGRTPMVKITSSVMTSIARFEMSWDGPGDMDLHLDSDAGWHISYASRNINQMGFTGNLDIDNVSGWGPENIRLFQLPGKAKVRCFVNYFSGNQQLNVTIRYFDKENKLVKAQSKVLSPADRLSSSQFGPKSWVIGTFDVEP